MGASRHEYPAHRSALDRYARRRFVTPCGAPLRRASQRPACFPVAPHGRVWQRRSLPRVVTRRPASHRDFPDFRSAAHRRTERSDTRGRVASYRAASPRNARLRAASSRAASQRAYPEFPRLRQRSAVPRPARLRVASLGGATYRPVSHRAHPEFPGAALRAAAVRVASPGGASSGIASDLSRVSSGSRRAVTLGSALRRSASPRPGPHRIEPIRVHLGCIALRRASQGDASPGRVSARPATHRPQSGGQPMT